MDEALRILQIEDSESDAALIVRLLEKSGYQVNSERVEDAAAMRSALARHNWDVIIADYRLPQFDAPAALRVLHEAGLDIPFIVVSGTIGEDLAVQMMRSGAHDYLMKNNLARLPPTVEREIREAKTRLERQRAEKALRESEERLAQAIHATELGAFDFYPQTQTLIWSEFTKHHFGLGPDAEVSYDTFLRGVHPDDRERVHRFVQSVLRSGGDGQYADEYRTVGIEDGIERWLSSQGRTLFDAEGRPFRFVGVTLDITERKNAERSLHESEQRFRRLVESDVVGIVIADAGRIMEANDYFLGMLQYTREELHAGAITWQKITPAEVVGGEGHGIRQLFQTGTCRACEEDYFRKDGKSVPILAGGVVLQSTPALQYLCYMVDLTDRKRLEGQLLQAQKMESIGRLAGGVAHDFNNLLTVITGYSEMLLNQLTVQDSLHDPVEEISKAAATAAALTRQLLTFSRRQPIEPKIIVLNGLVRDVEKMLRRLIGEDIELVLSLGSEAGVIRADPGQIEQVIMNLAVNARDAMPDGGKLVIETSGLFVDEQFAEMHLSMAPGAYVMLAVTDTGSGMSPEVKARIFEPFFTTKELGKGTGLGLSTVYGTVQQSGGSIWVYSEPGQGSVFKLLFPAVEAVSESVQRSPVQVTPSGSETILLAEDEAGVRKYVRQILERHGYTVLETSNGLEALAIAQQHPGQIHLLLTDVVMPGMGGTSLADQVVSARPGIPVLRMSGYTDRVWNQAEPIAAYIQKPFTPAVLLTQIRSMLDSSQDSVSGGTREPSQLRTRGTSNSE